MSPMPAATWRGWGLCLPHSYPGKQAPSQSTEDMLPVRKEAHAGEGRQRPIGCPGQ